MFKFAIIKLCNMKKPFKNDRYKTFVLSFLDRFWIVFG